MDINSSHDRSEPAAPEQSGHDDAAREPAPHDGWVLKVLAGVHAGGKRRCSDRDVVLVGAGDDCDLILSDTGVSARHCLISTMGEHVFVRALDAPVRVGERIIAPGEPERTEPMQEILIGCARLCIGAPSDERWSARQPVAADPVAAPAPTRAGARVGRRVGYGLALALVAVAGLLLLPGGETVQEDPAAIERQQLAQRLDGLALDGVRIDPDPAGRPTVRGHVATSEEAERLQQSLAGLGFPVENRVRVGTRIANDVSEVLRMAGISAQARYQSGGVVEVRGEFDDPAAVQNVLDSSLMGNIQGLVEVNLVDLGPRQAVAEAPVERDERFVIVRAHSGDDPYIVTADASRYYLGATLPTGQLLLAIRRDAVFVIDWETGVQRLDLSGPPPGVPQ